MRRSSNIVFGIATLTAMSWMFAVGCGNSDDDTSPPVTTEDAGLDGTVVNPIDAGHADAGVGTKDSGPGTNDSGESPDTGVGSEDSGADAGDATVTDSGSDGGGETEDAGDAGKSDAGDAGDAGSDAGLENFHLVGRWDTAHRAGYYSSQYPGSGIIATYTDTTVTLNYAEEPAAEAIGSGSGDVIDVYIDGKLPATRIALASGTNSVTLPAAATMGTHTVEVYKATDGTAGTFGISATKPFTVGGTGAIVATAYPVTKRIEFIGDDQTWGYGDAPATTTPAVPTCQSDAKGDVISATSTLQHDENLAYPYLVSKFEGAEHITSAQSLMGAFADDSYATATDTTYAKADTATNLWTRTLPTIDANGTWKPSTFIPDVVVVNLGGASDISNIDYKMIFGNAPTNVELDSDFSKAYASFLTQVYAAYSAVGTAPYFLLVVGPEYALYGSDSQVKTDTQTALTSFLTANPAAQGSLLVATPPADDTYLGCDYRPWENEHAVVAKQIENQLNLKLGASWPAP